METGRDAPRLVGACAPDWIPAYAGMTGHWDGKGCGREAIRGARTGAGGLGEFGGRGGLGDVGDGVEFLAHLGGDLIRGRVGREGVERALVHYVVKP